MVWVPSRPVPVPIVVPATSSDPSTTTLAPINGVLSAPSVTVPLISTRFCASTLPAIITLTSTAAILNRMTDNVFFLNVHLLQNGFNGDTSHIYIPYRYFNYIYLYIQF